MRTASSIVAGITAVLLLASPGWTDTLKSTVTDPVGDSIPVSPCEGLTCEPYQDILGAEIAKKGGMFILGMTVAAAIPDSPPLHSGVSQIVWAWRLDTNPATFPAGFPLAPGFADPWEFLIVVVWDGVKFSGELIDRRPLLEMKDAVVTPVALKIKNAEAVAVVDETLLGDPSGFDWRAGTTIWATEFGTMSVFAVDVTTLATWPS